MFSVVSSYIADQHTNSPGLTAPSLYKCPVCVVRAHIHVHLHTALRECSSESVCQTTNPTSPTLRYLIPL